MSRYLARCITRWVSSTRRTCGGTHSTRRASGCSRSVPTVPGSTPGRRGRRSEMKRAGVLSRESVTWLRFVSRKFGWHPRHENVWHLLDTVDAQRLVIDRLRDGWQPTSTGHWTKPMIGIWDPLVDSMSRAEQIIV